MLKIEYCNKKSVEERHLKYVKARICKNAKDLKNNAPNEWHILSDLIKSCNKNRIEEVITAIAICPKLEELVLLQERCCQAVQDQGQDKQKLLDVIEKLLDYKDFNTGLQIEYNGEPILWNRHELILSSNTKICPYCGRQYITPLTGKALASCDHYYPKALYPLLSINMYNLVPCCHICNSILKGNKVKNEADLHLYPYKDDTDSLKFQVDIRDADSLYNISADANSITVKINKNKKRAEQSLDLFCLQEIYQYHAKDTFELRNALCKESSEIYQEIFKENYEQLKPISNYAFSYRDNDPLNEPLVKFRRDIEEQFKKNT